MSTGFREDRFKRSGGPPPTAPADDHVAKDAPRAEPEVQSPPVPAETGAVQMAAEFKQAVRAMQDQDPDAVKLYLKVQKTTPLSQLPLPMELLGDPDLWRYFDQMKLLQATQHPEGLLGLTVDDAAQKLMQGIWGAQFPIQVKLLTTGPLPLEFVHSRFLGMLPMYKAHAGRFKSLQSLKLAIEEDIALYLQKGKSRFPVFAYRVIPRQD